jgi:hypothetical protein
MKYAIEHLTAPKPEWDFAFVFIKGIDNPIGIVPSTCKIHFLRDESLLELIIPRVSDPINPPTEGGPGPHGMVEATPGGLAKLTAYVHIDEITSINFYNSFTEEDYKAIGAKAKSKEEFLKEKSTILTAEGENPDIAKEREELFEKQEKELKEKHKKPSGIKKVD